MAVWSRNRGAGALAAAAVCAGLTAGCGGGGDPFTQRTDGTLTLAIADAPADDAEGVFVQFAGVELRNVRGGRVLIEPRDADGERAPRTLSLHELRNGARALLLDAEFVDPDTYQSIRLLVNAEADGELDSYLVVAGATHELRIPEGAESGLLLFTPFRVDEQQALDFTVDFDLRQSLLPSDGQDGPLGPVYLLRPTLRLVDTQAAGRIAGTVDPAIFQGVDGCETPYGVYVFAGEDSVPADVDGGGAGPVSVASVATDGSGAYTAAFLPTGAYSLYATCHARRDAPDRNDLDLVFVGPQVVDLAAGAAVTVTFR
jgi:hypothetical protein